MFHMHVYAVLCIHVCAMVCTRALSLTKHVIESIFIEQNYEGNEIQDSIKIN